MKAKLQILSRIFPKVIIQLSFFTILMLTTTQVFSTHIAGGYINYECTGTPNQYEITLTLYRDCSGMAAPTNPSIRIENDCNIYGGGYDESCFLFVCVTTYNFGLDLVSSEEVSQLCDEEEPNSTCNGGGLPGYEEYIYKGTITLPDECDSWKFSYSLCCRNTATNMVGEPDFYTETSLNTATNNCNNSPVATAQPQPFVCVNQPVTYNLGAYEPDGDNITYSLANSQSSNNNSINYQGGYNGQTPIQGITIDPNTGIINYTPTIVGNFVIAIRMDEYDDDGNHLGYTIYDFQVTVQNCSNIIPEPPEEGITDVTGAIVQVGPNEILFCSENYSCFNMEFSDPNLDDVLTVTSNIENVIPDATISYQGVNPVIATICWEPPEEYATHVITFLVEDDACPIVGQNNYSLTLHSQPGINVDLGNDIAVDCDGETDLFPVISGGNGNYTYEWSTGATTPALTGVGQGTYWVEVYDDSGTDCYGYDEISVTVNAPFDVDFSFNDVCPGEEVNFIPNLTGNPTIISWEWDFDGDGVVNSTDQSPIHVYSESGDYDVTLTVADDEGCQINVTHVLSNDFSLPQVDFSFNQVCEGELISFVNETTIGAPATIQSYEWDILNNGIVNYTSENPSHTFNLPGIYEISLTVLSDLGCENSVTHEVVIYDLPEVDFSYVAACEGEDIEFNDLTSVDFGSIETWGWDFSDGATSNEQNPAHTFQNYGVYDVTLVATSEHGCTAEITQEVYMLPPPEAEFTFENACYHDELSFTDLSVGVTSWSWDFGDGSGASSQQNPTYSYNAPGIYNVTLLVISASGCHNTTEMEVVAYPSAESDYDFVSACVGDEVFFEDNSTVSAPYTIVDYQWDFHHNGSTQIGAQTNFSYETEGNYEVTLTTTTDQGCENTVTKEVFVYPLPSPGFTSTAVCLDDATELENNSTISNNFTSNQLTGWEWRLGNGTIVSNQENIQYIYDEDGSYEVMLIVTSNHGCVDSISQTVIVHPLPEVDFQTENPFGCTPVCAVFNDESSINSGMLSEFYWDFGDGIEEMNSSNVATHCFENESHATVKNFDVTLTVVSDMGCESSLTKYSEITVYPIPLADFTFNPSASSVYSPEFFFHNTSLGGNSYLWDFAGQGVSENRDPKFKFPYDLGDTYPVELIVANHFGCSDTVLKQVTVKDELIVYVPNAFTPDGDGINDLFGPVIQGHKLNDYSFLIFNRWGELVFETSHADSWWDGTHNGSIAQQGVYVWKLVVKRQDSGEKHEYLGHVTLLK